MRSLSLSIKFGILPALVFVSQFAVPNSVLGAEVNQQSLQALENVAPNVIGSLVLSDASQSFSAGGGSYNFTVTANVPWSWSIVGGDGWFTSSEGVNQTGNQTFSYDVAANPSTSTRTASIRFLSNAGLSIHTITQAGAAPFLSVGDASRSFTATGGSFSFTVNANTAWTWSVAGGGGWFTSSENAEQTGTQTFVYTIPANTSTASRTATITFISGTLSATHTVSQAGAAPSLSVSDASQSFSAAGGSYSFTVNANVAWVWSGTGGTEWFTSTEAAAQSDTRVFSYSISPNTTTAPRSLTVTFISGALSATHTITQAGAAATLSVNDASQSFSAAGGAYGFTVNANIPWSWSAAEGSGWFTSTEEVNQSGTQIFSYIVSPNNSTASRSTTLTFISGGLSVVHNITQAGKQLLIELLPDGTVNGTLFVDPSDAGKCFVIEASVDLTVWTAIQTNTSSGITLRFNDRAQSSPKARFYRAQSCVLPEPPNPPGPLTLSITSEANVRVEWGDNSLDETGFEIERSVNGSDFSVIANTPSNPDNAARIVDTSISPGGTYFYRVRALKGSVASAYSEVRSVSVPARPVAPGPLALSITSAGNVRVEWADNSVDETGFEIERASDGVNYSVVGTAPANPDNAARIVDTSALGGRAYCYRVRSIRGSIYSDYSSVACILLPPNAPTLVSPCGATGVVRTPTFVWNDATGAERYIFEIAADSPTNPVVTRRTAILPAGSTSHSIPTTDPLSPNRTFYWRVRAENQRSPGEWQGNNSPWCEFTTRN